MGRPGRAGGALPDQYPRTDLFVCSFFDFSFKDDLASMEHPIFSLSTRPDQRILSYEHNGVAISITPSVKGRATIHDKDILIYCISQIMAALNAGQAIGRTVQLCAHDLLVATNRDTGGDGYKRLRNAFERLAGTQITTNINAGDTEITSGFGLIESWQIVRKSRGGRMISVMVTLSEWLYQAVLSKSVLTLSPEYFRLRKPLERRLYELVRKHCGHQPEWRVSMVTLHKKSGSAAPIRVFRAAIRRIIADRNFLGYELAEQPGDILRATPRQAVVDNAHDLTSGPILSSTIVEEVRRLAPGMDAYAIEARWRVFWQESGRPVLGNPDKVYLAWVRDQAERGRL